MKNGLDEQYIDLLKDILENGIEKNTRNGKVLSVFGRTMRYKFKDGKFPLLTTKKMAWNTIVVELLWFLRGDTNIKFLVDNGCNIWNGDAFRNYINTYKGNFELDKEEFINAIKTSPEFAKRWGELGPIYGAQWRKWKGVDNDFWINTDNMEDPLVGGHGLFYQTGEIDQIQNLINDLKTNPDSRRLLVSAWNPSDLDSCVLPPCHYGFQVYTRELSLEERLQVWNIKFGFANEEQKNQFDPNVHLDTHGVPTRAISLMWNQRSVDTGLGLSFNIASYSLLLMMISKQVNMVPDELIGNLGDVHLYLNHIEPIKEQLTREPYELPTVKLSDRIIDDISEYTLDDIILENYQSHPTIKMPLSN